LIVEACLFHCHKIETWVNTTLCPFTSLILQGPKAVLTVETFEKYGHLISESNLLP